MFSSSEKSCLRMETEYLQQKHNLTGNNFTCTVKQEDCNTKSLLWLVFCFSSSDYVSLLRVYWEIHGLPQFQGSLWPKTTQNLRKELGGQALARVSQCSSTVHISREAGPGSVPGTVVQSQSKCRGYQWPSQLQHELRAWVKATKGCDDLAKYKKCKDARYCLACADYFWLRAMKKVQGTGHQIPRWLRSLNTSVVQKASYIFSPSTHINQLILIRGLGRSQVAPSSFYWYHKG